MMLWVSEQGEKSHRVVNFPGQFGKTGASDCLFIFGQKGSRVSAWAQVPGGGRYVTGLISQAAVTPQVPTGC